MHRWLSSPVLALAPLILAATVVGCSNPADGKPEATVAEPAQVPELIGQERTFVIDPAQSTLGFVGSKITGSHDGGFNSFSGTVGLVDDAPSDSRVAVEIDTTSLWANDDRLTKHLKSPDFFDVDTYPDAVFESTSIEPAEDGFMVTGNLTLHGVTKSISFPARIEVAPDHVAARAEFSIKRFDFDIVYPGKPDDLIRDEVVIHFDLVAVPEQIAAEDAS